MIPDAHSNPLSTHSILILSTGALIVAPHVATVPPVVEPFSFPSDLVSGRRAGVACVVSAGDLPIRIKWLKDGSPLDKEALGATLATADFTSSLSFAQVTRSHRGNYSCVAENPAAAVSFSTQMIVQGLYSATAGTPVLACKQPPSASSECPVVHAQAAVPLYAGILF